MKPSLNFSRMTVATVLCCALAACAGGAPEYYREQETRELVIPEHLDTPPSGQALFITEEARPMPRTEVVTTPPRINASSEDANDNSNFRWSADGLYLYVKDSADSVDRRLGHVLQRAGMIMLDPDDNGEYRFEYWQPEQKLDGFFTRFKFWQERPEDYSGAYKTVTLQDGENARIYLRYADDTECEPDAAEHVLQIIDDRLG